MSSLVTPITAPLHAQPRLLALKAATPTDGLDLTALMARVSQAIDESIRRHPGGYPEVARLIGSPQRRLELSVKALAGHANPGRAKLGLVESVQIAIITGDSSWVHDIAAFFGSRLVPLPPPLSDSLLPEVHVRNVLRSLGLMTIAISPAAIDPSPLRCISDVTGFVQLTLELADRPSLTFNQSQRLNRLFFALLDYASQHEIAPAVLQIWLQLVADASIAQSLLRQRLPSVL